MMKAHSIPVLLDTDIGTNIDDAFCLGYLLRHSRCQLLGVTTAGSDAPRRADLARALCSAFGRADVQVVPGYRPAGSPPGRSREPWQADLVETESSAPTIDPARAIQFMSEVIRSRPGELTLVTIGPLTSIARLLNEQSQAIRQVRAVVSMCGLFGRPPADYGPVETNVRLDPQAAARVFDAKLPAHHILGLETTGTFELPSTEVGRRLGESVPSILRRLVDGWKGRCDVVRFHDPMAAVSLFEPELFTFEPARCAVQLEPPDRLGHTVADRTSAPGPHRLLTGVDHESFVETLFDTLN